MKRLFFILVAVMIAVSGMAGLPTSLFGLSKGMSLAQVKNTLSNQGVLWQQDTQSEDIPIIYFYPQNRSLYGIEFDSRVTLMFNENTHLLEDIYLVCSSPTDKKQQAEQAFKTLIRNLDAQYKTYKCDYWNTGEAYDFSEKVYEEYTDYANDILLSAKFYRYDSKLTRNFSEYHVELDLFFHIDNPINYGYDDGQKATVIYHKNDKHNYEGLQEAVIPATSKYGEVPYRVYMIEASAFKNCKTLRRVSIPASVRIIGANAFLWCDRLERIDVAPDNPNYCSIDGVLFTKDMRQLILYPQGRTAKSYVVPKGVKSIGPGAFLRHQYLESIVLPNSIDEVEILAFAECPKLKYITAKAINPPEIRYDAFQGVKTYHMLVPRYSMELYEDTEWKFSSEHIESWANLGEIDSYGTERRKVGSLYYELDGEDRQAVVTYQDLDPENNYRGLTNVNIPATINVDGITYEVCGIVPEAFRECKTLRSVSIPSTVSCVGYSAFYGCENLTSVTCHAKTPPMIKIYCKDCGPETEGTRDPALNVPAESIGQYKKAKGWKDFKTISPIK